MVNYNIINLAATYKRINMQTFANANLASNPINPKSIRGYILGEIKISKAQSMFEKVKLENRVPVPIQYSRT